MFIPTVDNEGYYTNWFKPDFEEHWPIGLIRLHKVEEKEEVEEKNTQ